MQRLRALGVRTWRRGRMSGEGMQNAMTVNNANGNNGMFGAVGATAC